MDAADKTVSKNTDVARMTDVEVLTDILGVGPPAFWDQVGGMSVKLTGAHLERLQAIRDRLATEERTR